MGFKTDTSFLKFVSMGAIGVRQTMQQLKAEGFVPIELERYCSSNKIWMTKVKRLRLPDLLCVRTGLRLEVRAKSDLKIRMSDAPNNPDRTWDAKMRDEDLASFIAIIDNSGVQAPADKAVFFTIESLRRSAGQSKLGPPKSASEGAERDRTWPAIIPSGNGTVISTSPTKLVVEMENAKGKLRKQTYTLKGKNSYARVGDKFQANVTFLAGAPSRLADLNLFRNRSFDPLTVLGSIDAVDRYAAVKAIPYRDDLRSRALLPLEGLLGTEKEERVALEAAASAARLGSTLGQTRIRAALDSEGSAELRMEAVFILTELGDAFAKQTLLAVAGGSRTDADESRQAAVWGLGKAGLKAYEELLPFISDPDENVALHAVVAFGADTPSAVLKSLVGELVAADPRRAAAASEALRLIGNEAALRELIGAVAEGRDWVLATLGRLPPAVVKPAILGTELESQLRPMLLLNKGDNWLATEDRVMDIAFLTKQSL
jgi:hypothetical protein